MIVNDIIGIQLTFTALGIIKMASVQEALLKLEGHERECAVRYSNIEKRLDEGSERFKKTEMMIWGIYPLIIGLFVVGKMFG